MQKEYVIIPAGGSGMRMGTALPKQFLVINGKPVILHTISRFLKYNSKINIVLALPESYFSEWERICKKFGCSNNISLVKGGKTRFESVKNALEIVDDNNSLVAIHDAVRPLVNVSFIKRCFSEAANKGAVIPVVPVKESIRKIGSKQSKPLNRSEYVLVQTPQVFRAEIVKSSYDVDYSESFTDDATVVEKAGYKVYCIEGISENIKITLPEDLLIAEALL